MQPESGAGSSHITGVSEVRLPRWIQTWVNLSENAFTIPGTRFKVGLDAIFGLVAPGVGDWASALGSLAMVWVAAKHSVPQRILLRMLFNVLLDATVGAIPILGDAYDLFFRSNSKNLKLLHLHAQTASSGMRGGQRIVVAAAIVIAASVVLLWLLLLTLLVSLLWGGFALFNGT